jgi:hypothetical protein
MNSWSNSKSVERDLLKVSGAWQVRFKLMFLDCLRLNAATRHQVTAQGNALGTLKPKISPERAPHFVATKRKRIKSLRPCRAESSQFLTQGVALGYHITPRWGLA